MTLASCFSASVTPSIPQRPLFPRRCGAHGPCRHRWKYRSAHDFRFRQGAFVALQEAPGPLRRSPLQAAAYAGSARHLGRGNFGDREQIPGPRLGFRRNAMKMPQMHAAASPAFTRTGIGVSRAGIELDEAGPKLDLLPAVDIVGKAAHLLVEWRRRHVQEPACNENSVTVACRAKLAPVPSSLGSPPMVLRWTYWRWLRSSRLSVSSSQPASTIRVSRVHTQAGSS